MSGLMQRRGLLALTGALAGLSLWLLDEVALRGGLPEWAAEGLPTEKD